MLSNLRQQNCRSHSNANEINYLLRSPQCIPTFVSSRLRIQKRRGARSFIVKHGTKGEKEKQEGLYHFNASREAPQKHSKPASAGSLEVSVGARDRTWS